MYKTLDLINRGLVVSELPSELQNDIMDIEVMSEKYTVEDETAIKFDAAIAPKLEAYLPVAKVEEEPIPVEIPTDNKNMFVSGNFYKQHPENILGEYEEVSGLHGRVMLLKGTIKDVERIDASLDLSYLSKEKNSGLSQSELPAEVEIEKEEVQQHVESVFKEGANSVTKKTINKKKAVKETVSEEPKKADLQNFKDVFKEYNKNISIDELKVFLWEKQRIGQALSDKWYNLAGTSRIELNVENPIEWVKSGLVYYFDGKLIPAYLYLAENVYDKMQRLVVVEGANSGEDKDYIIKNYGQQTYDNQLNALKKKHEELYARRLIIKNESADDGLVLIPNGSFAKNFFITSFIDEVPFEWKMIKRQNNYGQIDLEHSGYLSYRDKHIFEKLNLTDAFCLWLIKDAGSIEYKKNTSYAEIIKVYIKGGKRPSVTGDKTEAEAIAEWERTKAKSKSEGDRLFKVFIDTMLTLNDKIRLEMEWNRKFNGYVPVDYNKVPVAFELAKTFRGEPFEIKSEKLDAIRFMFVNGSGCFAYDVGVGKTLAGIFTIEQFIEAGYCLRPFIVVPNQTYRQWLMEIKNALPHRIVNDMYNLRGEFKEQLEDENRNIMKVEPGSISVMTYEGFETLGFNESTQAMIMSNLYEILNQGGAEEQMSDKQREGFKERLETMMGKGMKGGMINIEELGFDFACYDEAHAMKKVFTTVKGEAEESDSKGRTKRGKTQYKIQSGMPSTTALKGFMVSQYILTNNHYRNVLLLTATPFTNSPLEIFSMLALIAYKKLMETDLNNINNFFDNYIGVSTELVINAKLQPQYRQVIKGFQNLPSLQSLIKRFFDYKSGEDIPTLIRPNKIVLPLTQKMVDGTIYKLKEGEKIDTFIPLSPSQSLMMDQIKAYAQGDIEEEELGNIDEVELSEEIEENEDIARDSSAVVLSVGALTKDEKAGVRVLKSMSFARNLALSPYLYEFSGLTRHPSAQDYINNSPKLKYICECVRSVKKYHEEKGEPISGQVIYMDRGIEYFKLIKQYLVEEVGYKDHEVGIIYSGMKGGSGAKEKIKNAFLGIFYNEKTKMNEMLTDDERMKVVIGSSTIKEGMNLQVKSTVLYDAFLDWNPTDFVQLTGRIHRQGNEFANVRIVCPLMIDSIDIFMFQKLEEKTERINTLWSSDGRSVLKLEEVDPASIKEQLIKDPTILAKMYVEIEGSKIVDNIASENNNIKRLESIEAYKYTLTSHEPDAKKFVEKYRPTRAGKNLQGLVREIQDIIRTQTDDKGYKFINSWERQRMSYADIKEKKINTEFDTASKPYWFDDLNSALRNLERERKDYLIPRGINEENLIAEKQKIEENIKAMEELMKSIGSEEAVKVRAQQIREKREREKYVVKEIPQLVSEFSRLNNLLSIKRADAEVKEARGEVYCEVKDDKGEILIDEESIAKLERCLPKVISSKSLHVDINGEYTPERKELHNKIIETMKIDKACIKNDSPIAILTGGAPGSGKTTFLKKYAPYLLSKEIYKIDADEVRAMIPEYKGWNSGATHEETRDIVARLLSEQNIGGPCMNDIIYDGTMNRTKNYLPLMGLLKRLGYKVFIIYINNIPYSEIVKRTRERYRKGDGHGNHRYVPISVIDDFFGAGKKALNELKEKVDGYVVVDGSTYDYKVIEKGGMELPKDREYSKLTTTEGLSAEMKPAVSKKDTILQKIKGFETLARITKDSEKKSTIEKKIAGFKTLLKITK